MDTVKKSLHFETFTLVEAAELLKDLDLHRYTWTVEVYCYFGNARYMIPQAPLEHLFVVLLNHKAYPNRMGFPPPRDISVKLTGIPIQK